MEDEFSRRQALKRLGVAEAAMRVGTLHAAAPATAPIVTAGQPVEIHVASISGRTVHITISPLTTSGVQPVPETGALASDNPGDVRVRARQPSDLARVRAGDLSVRYTENPPT